MQHRGERRHIPAFDWTDMELLQYDAQLVLSLKGSELGMKQNFPSREGGNLRKLVWGYTGKPKPKSKAQPKKRAK